MNPRSNILCIFEGAKRETQYFNTLKDAYFSDLSILVCSFDNNIYRLYKELKNDEDLDIVEILRESKNASKSAEILEGYERDDFSQVFLFFDFECQDPNFTVDGFLSLLEIFREETENGKVFISYPMIEAIRDIPSYESYLTHKVQIDNCPGKKYKPLSTKGIQAFDDPRKINKEGWDQLVKLNVEKGNYIISGDRGRFSTVPNQKEIAEKQVISASEDNSIFVLSSFPLFVYHQKPSQFLFQDEA